jgi:DNA/RNA endonuclease YhcR with UshA esterase domain
MGLAMAIFRRKRIFWSTGTFERERRRGVVPAVAGAFVALLVMSAAAALSTSDPSVRISGKVGGPATVEGVVSQVHVATKSGVTFIDMGGRYPDNAFSAVIWPEDAGKFSNIGAFYGRAVKITGDLRLYHGKPEIMLKSPSQMQVE